MKKAEQAEPNQRLREARKQHYWTQSQVAEQLGTTVVNVNRWEQGKTIPSLYFRQKLCELFHMSAEELGLIPEAEKQESKRVPSAPARPIFWNVPFRRNPYFTGRQDVLACLEAALQRGKAAALVQTQAISGLGGIGKTQTAVEYAYRQQSDYQAVLWAKADSREVLAADFVNLASVLQLPEQDEQDQSQTVRSVKAWLKDYPDWLLILDNVEDLDLIRDYLPSSSRGHIMLTTRRQSTGSLAECIDLKEMETEEGALLLLRRAKLLEPASSLELASSSERVQAMKLAQLLEGLPLALDQAAAYIEETECGLAGYLERYQTRRARLLNLRGGTDSDHPEAVATTWSLSFEKVQQANPAAADLLRLCAFLRPDAIPEEIINQGGAVLGPVLESLANDPLALDAAIRELRKYSLMRRDPEVHMLQVHRLVQAVLQDTLEEREQHRWAECVMLAINAAFPASEEHDIWLQCERLLPHALLAIQYIEAKAIVGERAGHLLYETASYLRERARYSEAEPLFQQALHLLEQQSGPNNPQVAHSLNGLAKLYHDQGKYEQAEPLFQRAIHLQEQQLGIDHLLVAHPLNNLAELYREQGKYEQAEPLYQRALRIWVHQLGPDHPDVSRALNNLASLYSQQGRYEQGEPLFQQALHIREQQLGPDHPLVATTLNNLASLYFEQSKYRHDQSGYEQAEPLFKRALSIWEQQVGPDHPDVGYPLTNLASLYFEQGKYAEF